MRAPCHRAFSGIVRADGHARGETSARLAPRRRARPRGGAILTNELSPVRAPRPERSGSGCAAPRRLRFRRIDAAGTTRRRATDRGAVAGHPDGPRHALGRVTDRGQQTARGAALVWSMATRAQSSRAWIASLYSPLNLAVGA